MEISAKWLPVKPKGSCQWPLIASWHWTLGQVQQCWKVMNLHDRFPTHESHEYYPATVGGTLFFISNFMSTGKHSSEPWTARTEQLARNTKSNLSGLLHIFFPLLKFVLQGTRMATLHTRRPVRLSAPTQWPPSSGNAACKAGSNMRLLQPSKEHQVLHQPQISSTST